MKLQFVFGDAGEVQEIELQKKTNYIGRSGFADIQIAESYISSYHAIISEVDGDFFIEDCDSKNGTYVNGVSVVDSTPVKPGDRIQFAIVECVIEGQPEAPSVVASPPPEIDVPEPAPAENQVPEVKPLSTVPKSKPVVPPAPISEESMQQPVSAAELIEIKPLTAFQKRPKSFAPKHRRGFLASRHFGASKRGRHRVTLLQSPPTRETPEPSAPPNPVEITEVPATRFNWEKKIGELRKRQEPGEAGKGKSRKVGRAGFGRSSWRV